MGAVNPIPEPIKVKFGREERTYGPLLPAKFDLDRCNVSPLRGEKTQNLPVRNEIPPELPFGQILPVTKLEDDQKAAANKNVF